MYSGTGKECQSYSDEIYDSLTTNDVLLVLQTVWWSCT